MKYINMLYGSKNCKMEQLMNNRLSSCYVTVSKAGIHSDNSHKFSPHLTVNTHSSRYKEQPLKAIL